MTRNAAPRQRHRVAAAVDVREANLHDARDSGAIVDVLNSYAKDDVGGGEALSDEVQRRLPQLLREHPTTVVLLAWHAGVAVGVAVCFLGLSTFRARPLLNLHDLAVVPGWRGKGVGRALLDAVEAAAVERDCCKLTLEVQDTNHRARAVYASFGFEDFIIGNSGPTRFLSKAIACEPWTDSE